MRSFALAILAALAGCAEPGVGGDRAHALTLGGGLGFALDQRDFRSDLGPNLGIGATADYYFADSFAVGVRYVGSMDLSGAQRGVDFHTLAGDLKLQGDLASWKPYAHAGFGWAIASAQDGNSTTLTNHWMIEWGGGFDIYVTENWAFTLDATMEHSNTKVFGNDDTFVLEALFGVKYKF